MSHKHIDRKSPGIMAVLVVAPVFRKFGTVKAREAQLGEKVTTTLANGARETSNAANAGDWIVTNPSGEDYIISAEKFLGRYESTAEPGVYRAKGYCRAVKNPFGEPIEIMASWGEPQQGNAECMIADTCDAQGKTDGEPYLIDAVAFAATYR